MGLVQILVIWGLATAGPFSFAQEEVTKGNQRSPYQPPFWIARMASPSKPFISELDSFIVRDEERQSGFYSVVPKSSIKYACKPFSDGSGGVKWQFCDM